jgi:hypothetical protein
VDLPDDSRPTRPASRTLVSPRTATRGRRTRASPILTFAPRLGRHVCKCPNRRTTSKIKLLVELLDLTFAWRARGNWDANIKSAPLGQKA